MSSFNFEYAIFIGHFAPFHQAHLSLLRQALSQAENVIVVIGSYMKARNIETPWTAIERSDMMLNQLTQEEQDRVEFLFVRDQPYNDNGWLTDLQNQVSNIIGSSKSVAMVCGERNNAGTHYSKLFPQWKQLLFKSETPWLKSEDIRIRYFTHDTSYSRYLNIKTFEQMEEFKTTDNFARLKSDFDYIQNYKNQWAGSPFVPTFNTADAVCFQSGHVLLVKRRGNPGRGQLALPGGFVNPNELIRDAAVRELKEETSIKLSKEELRKAIVDEKYFDAPKRSLRGRTITHAFCFNFGDGELLPVKGGSDAGKAFWMPLAEVQKREDEFFEDHKYIIDSFVAR